MLQAVLLCVSAVLGFVTGGMWTWAMDNLGSADPGVVRKARGVLKAAWILFFFSIALQAVTALHEVGLVPWGALDRALFGRHGVQLV